MSGRLVMCPYNEVHMVRSDRLAVHISKCSKAAAAKGQGHQLLVCPFNTAHHISKEQLHQHMTSCPDRDRFDTYKYTIAPSSSSASSAVSVPVNPIQQQPAPAPAPALAEPHQFDEEDWGQDEAPGYDPNQYLENEGNVLRILRGAPPAERRAYRLQQRREFTNN